MTNIDCSLILLKVHFNFILSALGEQELSRSIEKTFGKGSRAGLIILRNSWISFIRNNFKREVTSITGKFNSDKQ